MTPAGIEPATFRFVARHLNHCATARLVKYVDFKTQGATIKTPYMNFVRKVGKAVESTELE